MSYSWDYKQRKVKTVHKNRAIVTDDTIDLIIDKCIELGGLKPAMKYLRNNNIIKIDYCDDVYAESVRSNDRYQEWKNQKEQKLKDRNTKIFSLKQDGRTNKEVAKIMKVSATTVYNVVSKNIKTVKRSPSKHISNVKKRSIRLVKLWNDNYFPGRVPTTATIEAFKLLGLEPPKNKY